MYKTALESPPRFQFEANSGTLYASQTNNCGPTCITKIACFYRDTWYGIEATRRLVMNCCVPTSPMQQRNMLRARGVPAEVLEMNSLSEMRQINAGGTRPFVVGIYMARVPAAYRDHPFTGWHAVCILDADYVRNGVHGMLLMDPNFSPPGGNRPDPDHGKKFYPDWVMQYAFIQNNPRWAIVPTKAKYILIPPPPVPTPTTAVADGDPAPMRYRRLPLNSNGAYPAKTVKPNKPVRKGALVTSAIWDYTGSGGSTIRAFGYIPKEDLPLAERQYGDVFLANWYHVNGDHIGYFKGIDIV